MSDALARRVQELGRAARMLAIIGASMKLQAADGVDPTVREQVQRGLDLALGADGAALLEPEAAELLPMIEMALVESGDLFQTICQPVGWKVDNETVLAAMGRASSSVFDRILTLADARPALARSLSGRFLDVGTGVGGIALRAAETCPDLMVEAIDIWVPALRIAEQQIAASPHRARIELRDLDVTALNKDARFTLAWLPTMFLPRKTVDRAIERIASASHPGAWLVASLYTIPDDPFAAVIARLRTHRGGGEIIDPPDLANLFRANGYLDIETDPAPLATFVLGRLP